MIKPGRNAEKVNSNQGLGAIGSGPGLESRRNTARSAIALAILVLASASILPTNLLPLAHAGGFPGPGLVCLNDASTAPTPPANPCPTTPHVFNGPFPSTPQPGPTQLRVGVYINGSAGMSFFDITLLTNHTILEPARVDLTGTVLLGTPSIVTACLSGVPMTSVCSSTDTVDTLHVAVVSTGIAVAPATGLLFTAVYNIKGTSPSTGVSIGFQTGCTGTSVAGSVCVTVAESGAIGNDPETIQTGTRFNNLSCLTQCSWFAIISNVTSVNLLQGATSGNHVRITATAPDGIPVRGTTTISFSSAIQPLCTGSPCNVPPTFNQTSCTPTCSVTATLSTSVPGNYTATIYGNYVGDNCAGTGPCNATYSLSGTVAIPVIVKGIGWTVNGLGNVGQQTMYFGISSFSIPYAFQSINGYSGTITLSALCSSGTTGVVCPVPLPPPFPLSAGQTITKLINYTATGEGRLLYKATMSPSNLPAQLAGTDTILISGFSIASNSTIVSFNSGSSGGILVTLTSLGAPTFQFTGVLTISSTVSPLSGLNVTCPTSVSLSAGSTAMATCSFSGKAGSYTATITATGGTNGLMTNSTGTITINVLIAFQGAISQPFINTGTGSVTFPTVPGEFLAIVISVQGGLFSAVSNVTDNLGNRYVHTGANTNAHFAIDIWTSFITVSGMANITVRLNNLSTQFVVAVSGYTGVLSLGQTCFNMGNGGTLADINQYDCGFANQPGIHWGIGFVGATGMASMIQNTGSLRTGAVTNRGSGDISGGIVDMTGSPGALVHPLVSLSSSEVSLGAFIELIP